MPKLYEAPKLSRFGLVADLTASDLKCSPGGDGGFETYMDHSPDLGDNWRPINNPGQTVHSAGNYTLAQLGGLGCRGVTEAEIAAFDITPNPPPAP